MDLLGGLVVGDLRAEAGQRVAALVDRAVGGLIAADLEDVIVGCLTEPLVT